MAYGCDCSAAGSGPEDSSPVSFHGRMRDDATMKIVPLIPLCLVSSATSHNGLNSILPLSIKAPVVAVHCHALFGARKKKEREDNARWNSARAFVCIFLFLRALLCRALAGKRHLEGRSDLFRVRGSSSRWKPIITCNPSFCCGSYDVKHMKRFMLQTKNR